ncbi:hypothetical protein SteCoe_37380 [Stentor coeruleus]|uniref:Anaphase-promoting complex subunit 4 WD40 domain-containing protein n=1 Tax=Stentor coeruleus TaxID=5963 RepID=A0A1R2AN43_9CILI|nr:hypothetical protein SteCoe_37380 [Stentor coeruleus]
MILDEVQKNQEATIILSNSLRGKEKFLESIQKTEDKIDALEKKYNLCIRGHQYRITKLILTHDMQYLFSYSMDQNLKFWDIKKNRQVSTQYLDEAETLEVCQSYKYIIITKNTKYFILKPSIPEIYRKKLKECSQVQSTKSSNLSTNEDIKEVSTLIKELKLNCHLPLVCIALSKNKKYAVVGSFNRTIRIFNMIKRCQKQVFPGHNTSITSIAISFDKRYLISASCDGVLLSWYIENSQQMSYAIYEKSISAVAIAQNNSCVVLASNMHIIKMNFNLVEIIRINIDYIIQNIEIATNKNRIILYITDSHFGYIKELDLTTLKSMLKLKLDFKGKFIRLTNDFNFGVVGYTNKLWFWKISKNEFRIANVTRIKSLSLIQNDKCLICTTKDKVFQFLIASKKSKTHFTCPKDFSICKVSLDQTLAICHNHDSTCIFNIPKNKKIAEFTSTIISNIVISHNSKFLIISKKDHHFSLFDLEKETFQIFEDLSKPINFVIFHNDDFFVSISSDSMDIWNIKKLKIDTKIAKYFGPCNCLALSKDDRILAYGTSYNKICISIWDLRNNSHKGLLFGHKGFINIICLSDDCSYVVSGSCDKDIMVWDLKKMSLEYILKGHISYAASIVLSQDNSTLYSGSIGGLIRVWDLTKKEEAYEIFDFQNEVSINMWRNYPELNDLHEWEESQFNSLVS